MPQKYLSFQVELLLLLQLLLYPCTCTGSMHPSSSSSSSNNVKSGRQAASQLFSHQITYIFVYMYVCVCALFCCLLFYCCHRCFVWLFACLLLCAHTLLSRAIARRSRRRRLVKSFSAIARLANKSELLQPLNKSDVSVEKSKKKTIQPITAKCKICSSSTTSKVNFDLKKKK